MDFANNMSVIARKCIPAAIQVNDRFHLHQLVHDALQDVRVKYRQQAIDEDNKAMKELGSAYQPTLLENGDTLKQLLVRSRYLLYKTPEKQSESRRGRAHILFERYPEIKTAYLQAYALNHVFKASTRDVGYSRLARWYEQVEQ